VVGIVGSDQNSIIMVRSSFAPVIGAELLYLLYVQVSRCGFGNDGGTVDVMM